jgi:hypothetical protein
VDNLENTIVLPSPWAGLTFRSGPKRDHPKRIV